MWEYERRWRVFRSRVGELALIRAGGQSIFGPGIYIWNTVFFGVKRSVRAHLKSQGNPRAVKYPQQDGVTRPHLVYHSKDRI